MLYKLKHKKNEISEIEPIAFSLVHLILCSAIERR